MSLIDKIGSIAGGLATGVGAGLNSVFNKGASITNGVYNPAANNGPQSGTAPDYLGSMMQMNQMSRMQEREDEKRRARKRVENSSRLTNGLLYGGIAIAFVVIGYVVYKRI